MPIAQVSDHTFFCDMLGSDAVVLDVGANRAAFSHEMIRRFGCRCVAVEANADLCAAISAHPRLAVMNAACSGRSGMLEFHISEHDEASSLLKPARTTVCTRAVRAFTLAEIVSSQQLARVDLMKMDIEGAEVEVLDSCADDLLVSMPQITVEFHDFNGVVAGAEVMRVIGRMRRLGFDVLPMWMRTHGDTLFVNRRKVGVSDPEWYWTRHFLRNWRWGKRFVRRKLAGTSTVN